AYAILLVEGQLLGLDGQLGFGVRGSEQIGGIDRQADDVGRRAVAFADVVDRLAVGAPHGRAVLAVEVGQLAVARAVGIADPDVIIGRAAIALAIPRAGAADIGDLVALGREDAFLALRRGDAPGHAAFLGNGVQLKARRKIRALGRGEQD